MNIARTIALSLLGDAIEFAPRPARQHAHRPIGTVGAGHGTRRKDNARARAAGITFPRATRSTKLSGAKGLR